MPIDIRTSTGTSSSQGSGSGSHPLNDPGSTDRLASSFGPDDPQATSASSAFSSTPNLSGVQIPWEDVSGEMKRRCAAILISGPPDSGRTWLALTAPDPIAYLDFAEKSDGRINDLSAQGKKIRRVFLNCSYRGTLEQIRQEASRVADLADASIADAYRWAKTIIVDTKDSYYDVLTYARLGTLVAAEKSAKDQKLRNLVYQGIKLRFRSSLIHYFRQQAQTQNRTNLVLIGKWGEKYIGGEGTGKYEDTKIDSLYDIDVILHTGKIGPGAPPRAKYFKPWMNNELRDKEVKGEDLDIAEILGELTRTDSDEWR